MRSQVAIDEGAFRKDRSIYHGAADMHVILPIALEIAHGMDYLHNHNVLHGVLCISEPTG